MSQPPTYPPAPLSPEPAPAPKTSGLAIGSLVCGLAGLCTLGLSAIAGLVLGILAHSRIARSGGRLGGRGLAVAGIAVSACAIVVGLLAGLQLIGLLIASRTLVDLRSDETRRTLDALDTALRNYAKDYNGLYPWKSTAGVMGAVHASLRPVSGGEYEAEGILYAALTARRRMGPYCSGIDHRNLREGSSTFTVFVDGWGRPIRYHPPKSGGTFNRPLLESEGPKPDSADDPASKRDNLFSYRE